MIRDAVNPCATRRQRAADPVDTAERTGRRPAESPTACKSRLIGRSATTAAARVHHAREDARGRGAGDRSGVPSGSARRVPSGRCDGRRCRSGRRQRRPFALPTPISGPLAGQQGDPALLAELRQPSPRRPRGRPGRACSTTSPTSASATSRGSWPPAYASAAAANHSAATLLVAPAATRASPRSTARRPVRPARSGRPPAEPQRIWPAPRRASSSRPASASASPTVPSTRRRWPGSPSRSSCGDRPPAQASRPRRTPVEPGHLGQVGRRPARAAGARRTAAASRSTAASRRRAAARSPLADLVPGQVVLGDRHVADPAGAAGQRERRLAVPPGLVVPAGGHPQRGELGARGELARRRRRAAGSSASAASARAISSAPGAVLERRAAPHRAWPRPARSGRRRRYAGRPAAGAATAGPVTSRPRNRHQRGSAAAMPQRGVRVVGRREYASAAHRSPATSSSRATRLGEVRRRPGPGRCGRPGRRTPRRAGGGSRPARPRPRPARSA